MNKEMSREDMLRTWRKQDKYKNRKPVVDGIVFDSKKEANRYKELLMFKQANLITQLVLQPKFDIVVNNKKIGFYKADFKYYDNKKGCYITEDCKGFKTPVYKLKKKLVEAYYNIKILET
jgi:hypothetical protein